jgi:DNA polymerase II small subunit
LLRVIKETLEQGYQISPEAMAELEEWKGDQAFIESAVKLVVDNKERGGGSKRVDLSDLADLFPDSFATQSIAKEETGVVLERSDLGTNDSDVEVISGTDVGENGKMEGSFSELFKSRYEKTLKIFMQRPEGRQLTKLSNVKDKGSQWTAGLVMAKREGKGGLEVTLDDDTGSGTFVALNEEVKRALNDCAVDECVMLEIEASQGRSVVKKVVEPDTPNELASTSKKRVYVAFLSDLHIGSNKFLEDAFDRFLAWLRDSNGKDGDMVRRLRYIVIAGDVVDGVGVFPNQEYELEEVDVFKQYAMVAEKLRLVAKDVRLLVMPGNHDATRQALPQPGIPRKYATDLYTLENLTMLGDPSFLKLSGVSILSFHGRSLDDVLATTPGLSYHRPTEPMRRLLKARHLAPIFGSRTPIAPELEDRLVIDQVPDIFHAGHVHTVGVERYKSTIILNSGTWQGQTGYQANLGISPSPGVVPIVNLADLEVVMKEFLVSDQGSLRKEAA